MAPYREVILSLRMRLTGGMLEVYFSYKVHLSRGTYIMGKPPCLIAASELASWQLRFIVMGDK